MFTYQDFMECTIDQIYGIMDGVKLSQEERIAFNKACEDRSITWDDYIAYCEKH